MFIIHCTVVVNSSVCGIGSIVWRNGKLCCFSLWFTSSWFIIRSLCMRFSFNVFTQINNSPGVKNTHDCSGSFVLCNHFFFLLCIPEVLHISPLSISMAMMQTIFQWVVLLDRNEYSSFRRIIPCDKEKKNTVLFCLDVAAAHLSNSLPTLCSWFGVFCYCMCKFHSVLCQWRFFLCFFITVSWFVCFFDVPLFVTWLKMLFIMHASHLFCVNWCCPV